MNTNSWQESTASDPFARLIEGLAPLIEAIAEAVARKLEERRRSDELAQAVLQRMREMGGGELAIGLGVTSTNGDDPSLSESEVYKLIHAVLSGADAGSEGWPSRDETVEGNPSDELARPIA